MRTIKWIVVGILTLSLNSAFAASPEKTRYFPLAVKSDSFKVSKVEQVTGASVAKIILTFTIQPKSTCQDKYAGLFQSGIYNPEFTVVYAFTGDQQCGTIASVRQVSHELWLNMGTRETALKINQIAYLLRPTAQGGIEIVLAP